MNETIKDISWLPAFPQARKAQADALYREQVQKAAFKIVALDDDPTGVQTVHGIHVYTDWTLDSIREGFAEENRLFFILTNSRGMTREETEKVHRDIGERLSKVSRESGKPFLLISRSDSTLRGHFPLETEILRETIEKGTGIHFDGEILCPFFAEGGRYTVDNVHYVKNGNALIPAGQTEFARDETFGYQSSDLTEYVEEKTRGQYKKEDVICISLNLIRSLDIVRIADLLCQAENFQKIIVNAADNEDIRIFAAALYLAIAEGHHFIIRGAAAIVKAMGNVSDIPLLVRKDMIEKGHASSHGGIIVVGSHTRKTTDQLKRLKEVNGIDFIPMDSDLVLKEGALKKEAERILALEEEKIAEGTTVCVYTKRAVLQVENDTPEDALKRSVAISDAVQSLVGELSVTPSFVIAKGGITSSDVGVKALRVHRALVLGQIQPGVPVWKTGAESRFPGIPYVIFPGNVGEVDTLKKAAEILMEK